MKKSILQLALCVAFLGGIVAAQTTTTITGTLKNLTGAVVTSGKVTFTLAPSRDTTMSGIARFSPLQVVCLINGSGLIKAQDGVSTCTVTMNTALQPPGTYYVVAVWPYNVKVSTFTFYAVLSSYDWSTVTPTPTTSPAQNFVDIFSTQTIGGDKTWTGTQNFTGALVGLSGYVDTTSNQTVDGNKTFTGATDIFSDGLQIRTSAVGGPSEYLDLFNPNGGVPTPHKYLRVNASGDFQILNSTPQALFELDDSGNLDLTLNGGGTLTVKTVPKYNSISTTGSGVIPEYATVDLTAQNAAITTTTLYAVSGVSAGQYRVSWDAKVTTVAGTSSTLGPLTIVYTDPDGVTQTITAAAQITAGTIATSSTGNSTTTVLLGLPLLLNCKAISNITYAFAYASNAANVMQYNLHIKLEAL